MRPSVRWAFLLVAFVGFAPAFGSSVLAAGFNPPQVQHRVPFFLEAQAESGPTSLSSDPNSTTTAQFRPSDAGPASGLANQVDYYAKQGGQSYDFRMGAPLDRTYFLNVSSAVSGTIHWTSAQLAAGADPENVRFRVEVFAGEKRVGVADRYYDFYPVGGQSPVVNGGWAALSFAVRPELHRLEAGEVLMVRFTRFQGTTDLVIGTHGVRQSFVSFPYFEFDPLASTFYLDGGFLTSVAGEAPQGGSAPEPSMMAPSIALVALAGLSLGARRRAPLALVVLFLAVALGGCLGGKAPPLSTSTSSSGPDQVEEGFEHDPELEEKGIGQLQGQIRDGERAGVPLPNSVVVVLGTNRFNRTDLQGYYKFVNMTPGTYLVRVDHAGFRSLEQEAEVVAGRISYLNFSLFVGEAIDRPSYDRPHVHDLWGGEQRIKVQDTSFTPSTQQGPTRVPWQCVDNQNECSLPLKIDVTKPVLPGTVAIELKVRWDTSQATSAPEFALRAHSPWHDSTNLNGPRYGMGGRAPGQSYRLAIYPFDADPGHQNFTNWHFTLINPTYNWPYNPAHGVITVGEVHVEMWIEKGVVPLEPKHRAFWGGNSTQPLLRDSKLTMSCLCDYPTANNGANSLWKLESIKDLFVPPGTKEIRGWMNMTGGSSSTNPAWTFRLKGANYPKGAEEFAWFRAPDEAVRTGPSYAFVIRPKAEETDKYYQSQSYWVFVPDDGKAPIVSVIGSNIQLNNVPTVDNVVLSLTAFAVKDPDYVEA